MSRLSLLLLAGFALLSPTQIRLHAQSASSALNRWTRSADLTAARAQACATVLTDGRLLVAGGLGDSGPVATVDIYGTDGAFNATAPMSQARARAACVTLADGRVLVAGGNDGGGSLNTAEIFDPSTSTWKLTGSLAVAREGHQMAMTSWGNVWVAGGGSNGAITGALELFRPDIGQFQSVGALNTPRAEFAMTPVGRTLMIAGGTDGTNTLDSVEIYDGSIGKITVAGSMAQPRKAFAAAQLLDGTVLMTGGLDINGTSLSSTEIFDPAKGTSVAGPALLEPRAYHSAYAMPNNGSVLIYGGTGRSGILGTTEVYTSWTSGIAQGKPLNNARRDEAKAALHAGNYLVAGGRNDAGFLSGSELFQFSTVGTDKADYTPGTPVKIFGGGWVAGEQVLVTIAAFPIDRHGVEFTSAAMADGAGNITVSGFAVDKSHLGMKFLMTAVGSQSQAQTTFTDGVNPTNITYVVTPVGPATPGGTVNVTVTVAGANPNTPGGVGVQVCTNNGCPTGLTVTGINGTTCDVNDICTLTAGANFTSSAQFSLSPMPAGTTQIGSAYSGDANYAPNNVNSGSNANASYTAQNFTTTKLTGGPASPAPYGTQTAYTANVCISSTANGPCNIAGTPTGNVQFTVAGNPTIGPALSGVYANGTVAISGSNNGVGSASTANFIPSPPLPPGGPYTISAVYVGDSANTGSNSTATATNISTTINQDATTTTYTLTSTPTFTNQPAPQTIVFGQPISVNATVSPVLPATATPTGNVSVSVDNVVVNGSAALDNTGKVTVALSSTLAVGNHGITVVYTPSGGANGSGFAGSQVTTDLAITVTKANTTSAAPIYQSGNLVSQNPPIYMSVAVTGNAPSTANPTSGTVQLFDQAGNTLLGTGTVGSVVSANCPNNFGPNVACIQITTPLTVGNHNVYAVYGGDALSFNASGNSATTGLNVTGPVATTWNTPTQTIPGAGNAMFGSLNFTLQGSVTASAGANGPDGHVNFVFDVAGANAQVNASNSGGTTTNFNISPSTTVLGGGAHNVHTTNYVSTSGGFTAPVAPNSPTFNFTIDPAPAPFTVTSTVNQGQQLVVTNNVTMTAQYTGGLTPPPTGTITFVNAAAANAFICSGTLGAVTPGLASCTGTAGPPGGAAGLQVGAVNAIIQFTAGDGNYTLGAQTPVQYSFTVVKAPTLTTLQSSGIDGGSTFVGHVVTLTATTTTQGATVSPTQANLTITPPGTNVANFTCNPGVPTANPPSVTVICTFTAIGPVPPAGVSVNSSATYLADASTLGSAVQNGGNPTAASQLKQDITTTVLTATSVDSPNPNAPLPTFIPHTVTLQAVVTTTTPNGNLPTFANITITPPAGNFTSTTCGGPLTAGAPTASSVTASCTFVLKGPLGTGNVIGNAAYAADNAVGTAASNAAPLNIPIADAVTSTVLTATSVDSPNPNAPLPTFIPHTVTLQAVVTTTTPNGNLPTFANITITPPAGNFTSTTCGGPLTAGAPTANSVTASCTFVLKGPLGTGNVIGNAAYAADNAVGTAASNAAPLNIPIADAVTSTVLTATSVDSPNPNAPLPTFIPHTVTLQAVVTTTTPNGNLPTFANITITPPAGNFTSTTCGGPLTAGAPTANSVTASCTFVLKGPLGTGNVIGNAAYAADNAVGTAASNAAPLNIPIADAVTTTVLTATSVDSPNPNAPLPTFIPHTVTLQAVVTTTTPNGNLPTFANITITPPAGNFTSTTCGGPLTAGAPTANSVTASCTFVLKGPLGTGNIIGNAAYAADNAVGTAASNAAPLNIPIADAVTTTVLTATSVDSPNPNAPLPTFIGHTVTLQAVVTTTTPNANLPTFANITITPPAGNFSSTTCGGPLTAGAPTANSVTASCTFVLKGPLGTGTVIGNAAYAADNTVGTAASTAVPLNIPIKNAATSTTLSATSPDSPNPNAPQPTGIGHTVTLTAVVTTTTPAVTGVQPTFGNIVITPPVGNSSGSTCATPAHNPAQDTPISVTVTCTFVVTVPFPGNVPPTITANANYNADNAVGTAASAAAPLAIPINAATTTVLTATSPDSPNPNAPQPTLIGHTVTLTAVVTTSTPGVTTVRPTFGNITIIPPVGNSSGSTCAAPAHNPAQDTATSVTVTCTFVVTIPFPGNVPPTITANASYAADNTVGTGASTAAPLAIPINAATSTVLTATSDNINANPPTSTEIGRTITLTAVVTTTTLGVGNVKPTFGNITITPPAGNSSNSTSTCANPTHNAALDTTTPPSVTVTCTFLLTGPFPNPATVSATANYAADNTVGTAASSQTIAIPVARANTATTLTAATNPLNDPSNAVQLGRVVTLTAKTVTSLGVDLGPSGSFTFTLPANTFLSPTCGTQTGNSFTVTPVAGNIVVSPYNAAVAGTLLGTTTVTCTFTVVPPSTNAPIGLNAYSVVYNAGSVSDPLTLSSNNATSITTVVDSTNLITPLTVGAQTPCVMTPGGPCATSGNVYTYGQPISLNSVLTSTTGLPSDVGPISYAPSASVTFAGSGLSFAIPITPNATGGTAAVAVPFLPPALSSPYNVGVSYPTVIADPFYGPSAANITFTVNKATTAVTAVPLTVGAGVANLQVIVNNSSAGVVGVGVPTGTVQINQVAQGGGLGALVATATLTAASGASCVPKGSSVSINACSVASFLVATGTFGAAGGNLVATYSGDNNFIGNNSNNNPNAGGGGTVTGVIASSSVSLTFTPAVAAPNTPIKVTASVSGVNGSSAPTGSVTFSDNGVIVGVASVQPDGTASLVFTPSPGSSHSILAVYSGDTTYPTSSTSTGLTITKLPATTPSSLSGTTGVFGQSVNLSVKIAGNTQSGLPTGTVQFFVVNGANIGSPVTIVNGAATLPTSSLGAGTYTIGITYSGDSTYSGFTATVGTITISQAQVTVNLTSTTNAGQMTLTAKLTVSSGAGTPSGTVTFTDALTGAVLGTAPVLGGIATLTIPATGDSIVASYSGDANFASSSSSSTASTVITPVSAASGVALFAPNEIVSLYGSGLATQTVSGSSPLTTTLGGDTVTVTDSAGIPRQALLFFVSAGQINFLIPAGTALGTATITVNTPSGSFTTTITVTQSTAALFTANNSGGGPLAAQVVTVTPGGAQTYTNTATLNGTTVVNAPISLSPATNSYYLLLYATGLDGAKTVTVTINGKTFTPTYFGPQGGFAGLDQVNALLTSSLAGSGTVNVSVTVDGQTSNVGTIAFASAGTN